MGTTPGTRRSFAGTTPAKTAGMAQGCIQLPKGQLGAQSRFEASRATFACGALEKPSLLAPVPALLPFGVSGCELEESACVPSYCKT
jgi:hypothetical protein